MTTNFLNDLIKEIANSSDQIVSIYSYGSVSSVDYMQYSDTDLLIIFKNDPSINELNVLANIKRKYFENGNKIDISIHTMEEILRVKTGNFFHNNRGLYFIFELKLTGRLLYGEDLILPIKIKIKELKKEIPRVINSMKYNLRKLLLGDTNTSKIRKIFIKYSLNCASAILYYNDIFPVNKKEIVTRFNDLYNNKKLINKIYNMRMDNYGFSSLDDAIVGKIYELICSMDSLSNS